MDIYVARSRDGDITAICDNPDTVEKLRDLIDDNIESVTIPHESKGNVFTITDKAGTERFAANEAEVIEVIVSTQEIQFRKDSTFYGMPNAEARAAMQDFLDAGHMANELTEDLDDVVIGNYVVNTIYSNDSYFYGKDIDTAHKNIFDRTQESTIRKEITKMANENTTTQKYEMSAEEIALRNELASSMASKAAEGKAVWQVPKDERPIMHMPVNPRTGNYFQNGTALMLMQAQFEQKTADNRWISAKALNVLKEKEGKDIFVKKGAAAVTIVSGAKPVKYFNYSQLHGKDVANGIEIVDKTKDSLGESMLNYMQFKATQAKDKAEVTKENFWELGKKAQYSATCFVQKMQTELEKSMSVFKDAMPEFENRLANIKGFDKQAEAKTDDDRFMRSMAWNLAKNPDKNDYVMKAAAAALIKQVPEKTVIKLIDKYAPEAAKDAVKQEQGKGKYSAFVMGVLKKDKMLEKKITEGKNKSAAR